MLGKAPRLHLCILHFQYHFRAMPPAPAQVDLNVRRQPRRMHLNQPQILSPVECRVLGHSEEVNTSRHVTVPVLITRYALGAPKGAHTQRAFIIIITIRVNSGSAAWPLCGNVCEGAEASYPTPCDPAPKHAGLPARWTRPPGTPARRAQTRRAAAGGGRAPIARAPPDS